MADLEWRGEPDRPSLRRAVRHRLRHFDPTLRVVAEGFLAEQSEIDLLAVGNEGELISVRIGRPGKDSMLLTRALSDLTWLRPRRVHLLKLAPGLGLEPSAEPRAFLLCPDFSPETGSAAENLPRRTIQRLSYRCLRLQGQLSVLLTDHTDPVRPSEAKSPAPAWEAESTLRPTPGTPGTPGLHDGGSPAQHAYAHPECLTDPPSPSSFRTGLTEADLGRPRSGPPVGTHTTEALEATGAPKGQKGPKRNLA